ncbi:hypothetical protein QVD17_27818 [Tagetes erecta]|uniref:Uncharacterized protein n=1 Tax=Tagetes erecta TaxID=13708 RepID=A0AAD8K9C7_TARER|nr:hypothetical protein QVD17_27818 [Tagetes erecta]
MHTNKRYCFLRYHVLMVFQKCVDLVYDLKSEIDQESNYLHTLIISVIQVCVCVCSKVSDKLKDLCQKCVIE